VVLGELAVRANQILARGSVDDLVLFFKSFTVTEYQKSKGELNRLCRMFQNKTINNGLLALRQLVL
jgi:hypothetical protein